jgi:hypothetical protein
MTEVSITYYMRRAGIRSNRELAGITGINRATVDRIVKHPGNARGYQIEAIQTACGMTEGETSIVFIKRR